MITEHTDIIELTDLLQRRVRRWRAIALAEGIVLAALAVLGFSMLRQAELLASRAAEQQQVALVARDAELRSRQLAEEALQTAELQRQYAGKPVSVLLESIKLRLEDLQLIDEPPGKLRGFSFTRPADGRQVFVWLESTPSLFSVERKWDPDAFRKATVSKIGFSSEE